MLLTVLAFMPVTSRPGFEIRNTLTPNRIIEISFLLIAASLLTASAIIFRTRIRFVRTPVYILLFFSLWALLSTLWSASPLYTFGKSLEFALLVYIATMISSLASYCPYSHKELLKSQLPYVLFLAVFLIIVANLVIYGAPFNFEEATPYRPSRLSLGTMTGLGSGELFALTLLVCIASSIRRDLKTICIISGMVLLVLTNSRSPIGIFLVAVLTMMYKTLRSSQSRFVFLFIMAFLLIILIILGDEIYFRLPKDFATLNNRIGNWLFALDTAFENALVGVGYLASRESLIDFATYEGTELHYWGGRAHNSYIEILLTTGIVGLGMLLYFVVYGFRRAIRSENLLFIGIFIYVIARGILDAILFTPGIAMFLLMLVMTRVAANRQEYIGAA